MYIGTFCSWMATPTSQIHFCREKKKTSGELNMCKLISLECNIARRKFKIPAANYTCFLRSWAEMIYSSCSSRKDVCRGHQDCNCYWNSVSCGKILEYIQCEGNMVCIFKSWSNTLVRSQAQREAAWLAVWCLQVGTYDTHRSLYTGITKLHIPPIQGV